ncbi:hypothetical protein SETIT_5G197300v2 [Setaria italica]|uniref:Uncharacterized protein n=1 Tax=Setaria italica TaxID=4555 RepID=A0A368R6R8_SETIT|nr:hypothetical protein SETIT_5G197300v2 [Setaria italica]
MLPLAIRYCRRRRSPAVAIAAAQVAAADAGKLIDINAPVDLGTESNVLHTFELPISLSALQEFGGAKGLFDGYMVRKQKIEATMGYLCFCRLLSGFNCLPGFSASTIVQIIRFPLFS